MSLSHALLLLVGLSSTASAVEVTDMPDALRGDVTLGYFGQFGHHELVENALPVGQRRIQTHRMMVHLEFAPVDGVSLYTSIPTTLQYTIRFPEAYEMMTDPATGQGHYIPNAPLDNPPEYQGSGGEGVWFGVAFAPYAERFNKAHQLTWRLDLATRTKPKKTFWEQTDGKRGASFGGSAYRVAGAFSADNGSTRPYMSADWTLETRRSIQVPIADAPNEVQVKPGSTFSLNTGFELLLLSPKSKNELEPYFDVTVGFGYRSWREIPSGIFLPDILSTSQGLAITQTEALLARAGLRFGVRFFPYMQWSTGLQVQYETPYFVEDVYDVKTGSKSYDLQFTTALSIGYR